MHGRCPGMGAGTVRALTGLAVRLALCFPLVPVPAGRAEPDAACTVSLANGDLLTGGLERLADGKLMLRHEITSGSLLSIDHSRITSLQFGEAASSNASAGTNSELRLADGTMLRGRFVKLTETALQFECEDFGQVTFPRSLVREVLNESGTNASVCGFTDQHTVLTRQGDVLIGTLQQKDTGVMTISGGAVDASFRFDAVSAILFPVPALPADTPAPVSREKAFSFLLTMRSGNRINGTELRVESGILSMNGVGGQSVRTPIGRLAEIAFFCGDEVENLRDVLLWGRYSDRKEELPRTVAALKEMLGPGWRIRENFANDFDAPFKLELMRSRTLIIPEQEAGWDGARAHRLAAALQPLAGQFLRRGGNIVLLGMIKEQTEFMKEAGLLDVSVSGNSDGTACRATPAGQRFFLDTGGTFTTANSTQFYQIGSAIPAVSFSQHTQGSPVVGRRVGLGWIILMGMDYYESNETTKKLLRSAVIYR